MNKKNESKKQLNKYLRFSGIALQMGLTIYLASKLGNWLDSKYINQHQMYTKICAIVAIFASIYSIIKQAINLSENNDKTNFNLCNHSNSGFFYGLFFTQNVY